MKTVRETYTHGIYLHEVLSHPISTLPVILRCKISKCQASLSCNNVNNRKVEKPMKYRCVDEWLKVTFIIVRQKFLSSFEDN